MVRRNAPRRCSRSTASCRATGPCSTARARAGRPMSRSSATRRRSATASSGSKMQASLTSWRPSSERTTTSAPACASSSARCSDVMSDRRAVVLVHGAWHGPWCWDKVVALLDEEGVPSVAVELPFTSFADDVAATRGVIQAVDGPVVLCGHSYGGAVITEAGHHPAVEHLVYLTAFALEEGESPAATAPEANVPSTEL